MYEYPTQIEIENKTYIINTDFRVALKCFELIEDEEINDHIRASLLIKMLFNNAPITEKSLELASKFLQCGIDTKTQEERKADMDFNYDKRFIIASFESDYHIDLSNSKTEIHWWKFCALLEGLGDKTVLNRVREIRNYDLSDIKDKKSKRAMIKAKKDLELPTKYTLEQKQKIEKFNKMLGIKKE